MKEPLKPNQDPIHNALKVNYEKSQELERMIRGNTEEIIILKGILRQTLEELIKNI